MVRRRTAAGVAVVLLIVIVLVINGCLKSQKTQSLKEYNQAVGTLAQESETQVAQPLFTELTGASGKTAIQVQQQVNQLRLQMQKIDEQAHNLSVPGEMTEAQRNFLLTLDFRVEGITKLAALIPTAVSAGSQQASSQIAADMEIFLASDIVYSQRAAPFIQQALTSNGIHEVSTPASHFLPNLGWLEPNTVLQRITGQAANTQNGQTVSGNHGSALVSTSVGTTTLAGEGTINHISGGGSPTFTVTVENSGEFPETNVKADVTVTAGGKQYKASHVISKTEPGKKVNVEIPVTGIPLGVACKIEVNIEGVPGENDLENNKATYLAIFSQ